MLRRASFLPWSSLTALGFAVAGTAGCVQPCGPAVEAGKVYRATIFEPYLSGSQVTYDPAVFGEFVTLPPSCDGIDGLASGQYLTVYVQSAEPSRRVSWWRESW